MTETGRWSIAGRAAVYQIQVQGRLDASWAEWLSGMTVVPRVARDGAWVTTLIGAVSDQAALRGLLCRIWDLNLSVITVKRIELA